jgi:hypothetical protein
MDFRATDVFEVAGKEYATLLRYLARSEQEKQQIFNEALLDFTKVRDRLEEGSLEPEDVDVTDHGWHIRSLPTTGGASCPSQNGHSTELVSKTVST